jgi:ankyrin repeat protein
LGITSKKTTSFRPGMQQDLSADDSLFLSSEDVAKFFDAVKSGNIDLVRILVESNEQYINCRTNDEWAYTGLHWAAQKGYHTTFLLTIFRYVEIVNYLLGKSADFRLEAKKVPWKPMLLAARYGHKSIVETFINAGENIDAHIACDSKYTALHCKFYLTLVYYYRCVPSWIS